MSEHLYVGKSIPRIIETDKVTGRAIYIDDLKRPGMLYGKILSSRYAHAKIKKIDKSKAEKLLGVRAVLTGYDIPDVRVGFIKDQTVLKKDRVRQFRDEVAAVAAISPEIAEEALDLIEVEYEELHSVFDPFEAMKEEALLIHEVDARGRPLKSNITAKNIIKIAASPELMAAADLIIDSRKSIPARPSIKEVNPKKLPNIEATAGTLFETLKVTPSIDNSIGFSWIVTFVCSFPRSSIVPSCFTHWNSTVRS